MPPRELVTIPTSLVLGKTVWALVVMGTNKLWSAGARCLKWRRGWPHVLPCRIWPLWVYWKGAMGTRPSGWGIPDPLQTRFLPHGLTCRIWSLIIKWYEHTYGHPPETVLLAFHLSRSLHIIGIDTYRSIMIMVYLVPFPRYGEILTENLVIFLEPMFI